MHWKIQRDPFLRAIVEEHGERAATDAGFFFDEDDRDAPLSDVDWLVTPRPRRAGRVTAGQRKKVALLSTGAFCPIHAGHLQMMEIAKARAEEAGYEVVGGYLSPGHDAYITMKCGPGAIPASVRLEQCARQAEATDWLSVDPWEALHRRVSVNYTDVTARLRSYLRVHVDPSLEVFFVCGGDNARFGSAFTRDGGCIIVGRPGSANEMDAWRSKLASCSTILWAEGDHPGASRELRAPRWVDERKRRLVVRLESARAVRTLGIDPKTFAAFQEALLELLSEHASVRTVLDREVVPGDEADDVLSLDAMRPAKYNLGVSRLFALGGYQLLRHVPRPGQPSLPDQIAALPKGRRFVLREDDRMTGGTLCFLQEAIDVAGTQLELTSEPDEDVIDSRDFLLGTDDGGLVVELPDGSIARAPYILPYVDPNARASIAADRVRSFSKSVWALNAKVFGETHLRVRDLPPSQRALLRKANHPHDRALAEACRWHVEVLEAYS